MTTLRELAQAVEDTWKAFRESSRESYEVRRALGEANERAELALAKALGVKDAAALDMARAILAALDAEREAGRREGLAASGHLCLELAKTVDPRKDLALRKGMHDAGAIILGMTDHEAQRRAKARAQEVASWTLPTRSGSGTEAARDAATDNAPETETP